MILVLYSWLSETFSGSMMQLPLPLLYKGGAFVTASAMLSNSFKRVKTMRMTRVQNCKSTCYFALGVIVLIFVAYLLMDKVVSR